MEWETEVVPKIVGEADFEILLPDNMVAQRALGLLDVAVSFQ